MKGFLRFVRFVLGGVFVGALAAGVTLLIVLSHYRDQATVPADCIVVFGAAVWPDNVPSHALDDRMRSALKLYDQDLSDDCLVLSGGPSTGNLRHEVDVMQDLAVAHGVPTNTLVLDYVGVDTGSTITNLSADKSYILVSNDFHLARISLFARRADLEFDTSAAAYYHYRYVKEPFFVFREMVALWYYGLYLDRIF